MAGLGLGVGSAQELEAIGEKTEPAVRRSATKVDGIRISNLSSRIKAKPG
jgi:hypothetical protein